MGSFFKLYKTVNSVFSQLVMYMLLYAVVSTHCPLDQVRRVQNFHETLDKLKLRNSNPFSNRSKTLPMTTKWETFDSGMGSLTAPPPMSSSIRETLDLEHFD